MIAISFADSLKNQRTNEQKKMHDERVETIKRLARGYEQRFEAAVVSECRSASAAGKRSVFGYLSSRWVGGSCELAIFDFDGGSNVFHGSGEDFRIESFGSEPDFADYLCRIFGDICRRLGFRDFEISKELRGIERLVVEEKLDAARREVRFVDGEEEYVIRVRIGW